MKHFYIPNITTHVFGSGEEHKVENKVYVRNVYDNPTMPGMIFCRRVSDNKLLTISKKLLQEEIE